MIEDNNNEEELEVYSIAELKEGIKQCEDEISSDNLIAGLAVINSLISIYLIREDNNSKVIAIIILILNLFSAIYKRLSSKVNKRRKELLENVTSLVEQMISESKEK